MPTTDNHFIQNFRVIGINYKKTDTCVRGLFAINPDQYDYLLSIAPDFGLKELFILSTCNRTEIYGVADQPSQLIELLCHVTTGDAAMFTTYAYQKSGKAAIAHLFHVAAGLDSQILGDFEILGQIKTAVKQSKSKGFIGSFMERLLNNVMQSSKAVKTRTELSSGTVSVSFAAIQYIKEQIQDIKDKKIALVGTGKIGRTTCRNLIHYLDTRNITLINRTEETAIALAEELGVASAPIESLPIVTADSDIIIISTNAPEPVVLRKHVMNKGRKLIIDLSVPCNVAGDVCELPEITALNVDALSRIKDETLDKRRAEVPKVLEIIAEHIAEFEAWHAMRKHVPVLKEVKSKLNAIEIPVALLHNCHSVNRNGVKEEKIQNVINVLAAKMRSNHAPGCHYIEAINDYIAQHG